MKGVSTLLLLALASAAYSELTQHNTATSTRTLRRLRIGKMYEKCFGKEHFEQIKMQIDPMLLKCLHSQPNDYLKTKPFQMSDVPSSGSHSQDETNFARVRNQIGNYTCLLESLRFVDHSLNLNVDVVGKYVGSLSKEAEIAMSMSQDAEDCQNFAKGAPSRLITKTISSYKYASEKLVRLGIFFHCLRGRMMMTCNDKEYAVTMKPRPPLMAFALARIPFLDKDEYAFEDLFSVMEDSSVWFSFSP